MIYLNVKMMTLSLLLSVVVILFFFVVVVVVEIMSRFT